MKVFDWHREKHWTHCTAVIVAAGSATRMRGVDKIMADLDGEPVIAHTIRSFERVRCIDEIVVVAREDRLEQMRKLEDYNNEVEKTHPWMPSAYNKKEN